MRNNHSNQTPIQDSGSIEFNADQWKTGNQSRITAGIFSEEGEGS